MRLKKHINEDILTDDMSIRLKKDCKPFLKDVKKIHKFHWHFLNRGVKKDGGEFVKKSPRNDRRPGDSPVEWHNALDKASQSTFGVKYRSAGTFCKLTIPTSYGSVDKMIFPIGDYYCLWSNFILLCYLFFTY